MNKSQKVNLDILNQSLSDKEATDFVITLRSLNYKLISESTYKYAIDYFSSIIYGLINNSHNIDELYSYIQNLYLTDSFLPSSSSSELKYRNTLKSSYAYLDISNFLIGNKILDFGCGRGDFGVILSEKNKSISLVDIVDARIDKAKHLPFYKTNSNNLPFQNNEFDTSCAFLMLHHNDDNNLINILKELKRVTKSRIIIKEDVYDLDNYNPNLIERVYNDHMLSNFIKLNRMTQFNILVLSDFLSNVIIQKNFEMSFPFNFKSDAEWQKIFSNLDFKLSSIVIDGMRRDSSNYYGSCHVYYILDI
jgi:ubiquinone/menaquinone biosynthesis C-methylase UbiE